MDIVFDHHIFYDQRFGGISRYYCEIAVGLSQRNDFSVSLVAPFHINEHLRQCAYSIVSGPYFGYSFHGARRIRDWGRALLMPFQYALNGNVDIIHETYYSLTPSGTGQFRVLTVYDMIHEIFSDGFKNDLVTTKAKKAAVARADHVICISESTRQDLIRLLDVDPRKTSVVYLGNSLSETKSRQLVAGVHTGKPYLFYVGHRGGYKNFSSLCRAFANSNFLKKEFDIVAFGGERFHETEQVLFKELGITGQVHHVGDNDDLLGGYYRDASLLVYPSLYEGFGIPPLEAMSFDCPVTCSNSSSIPEVVGDAGIYFNPYSVDSLRDAIERVVGSPELCADLVAKGRKRLLMFSWEKCASETAEIYKSVVEGG